MGYSVITHALIDYVESHLDSFDIKVMSGRFGFSENYLRELFLKNVKVPVKRYYRRRQMIASAFEILHSDKKIVDIALENGFSSHESYTRAFRRVFHMTPSQFRSKRPVIGGRPLGPGVFGLDCRDCREPGTASGGQCSAQGLERQCTARERDGRRNEQIMEQNKDATILYGIRQIRHGAYGSNTMFPICIKAVSEYLGEDVSYAYIMAATGAAFRFVWNREEWDLSNIDIYHTLRESNTIYQYGAKALGREFSFLGREEDTPKEAFTSFIKSSLAKGYPVIALGIIGPPEPCIIAGYEPGGDVVMGWNFFQNDPEFAEGIQTMDNGYFRCDSWWENTDTQAVMCIGASDASAAYSGREIVRMAADIMQPREDYSYAKGIRAYEAWKEMLLEEKWFEGTVFDQLFFKFLVQNDAMICLSDGRGWAAKYFEELSGKCGEAGKAICQDIAGHFRRVSGIAKKMTALIDGQGESSMNEKPSMEEKMQRFGSRPVREKLAALADAAKAEDEMALKGMEKLLETTDSISPPNPPSSAS